MCGIVGAAGAFVPEAIEEANWLQRHRGPDDAGVFLRPGIALGHVRLTIIDLSSAGHQPMMTDDGEVVLVFNGEIYNYRELRRELAAAGHTFRGSSDTEVLLQMYVAHGDNMLHRLNGIFAFAIWDGRKGELLVARDALGVKPLYFAALPDTVAFASELRALLRLVPDCRELDVVSLHRYLSFLWCPGEGTPLQNVRKLGPGEAMIVRAGRIVRRWRWYRLPAMDDPGPRLGRRASIEGTTAHLRTAVQRQMVADVPVGAFLSGGLDSSAVVAFAREQEPGIQCFTIRNQGGQDAGFVDDLPYALRVGEHLGVRVDVVEVRSQDVADDLQRMIYQLEEPLIDTAPLNILYISELARSRGIKVLLSGAGGDDLFTGYRRHLALYHERYWRALPSPVLRGIERALARTDQRNAWFRRLTKLFAASDLDGDERIVNYFFWGRESLLRSLYAPEVRARLQSEDAAEPMLEFLSQLSPATSPLARMLALEQRFFLTDFNLTFTDKMSMAAGVEVRVPFLDVELVDFAARIPDRYKQHGREGKWVLKKAMEPFLPSEVIYRQKTGFGGPMRRWLREGLQPLLTDLLSRKSLDARGIFDPVAVQRLIADNDAGHVDAAYVLVALLGIEMWCRAFVDRAESLNAPILA